MESLNDFQLTKRIISREMACKILPELEDNDFDFVVSYMGKEENIGYIIELKGNNAVLSLENMTYACSQDSPVMRDYEKLLYLYASTNALDVPESQVDEIRALANELKDRYHVAYVFNWIEEVNNARNYYIR